MGKEKLGGLPGERLSLVHRYMTDAAAEAAPEPEPEPAGVWAPQPEPAARALPAVDAPPAKAQETPAPENRPQAERSASQVVHEPDLPIYEWSRGDAAAGEGRNDSDWPHELLRLRVERDRAGEPPT